MKKLLYPLAFALSAFLFVYSCSTDEAGFNWFLYIKEGELWTGSDCPYDKQLFRLKKNFSFSQIKRLFFMFSIITSKEF